MAKKYNIIGDIHSREIWKKLVQEDCINIFVGDYFSPYFPYPFEEQRRVFMDIIEFKASHPETILLIGNHDEDHWHIHERYSRFDAAHFNEIKELFEENKDLFQAAYSIDNKVLVTHAGVSVVWYVRYKYGKHFVTIINLIDEPDEYESPYSGIIKNDNAIKYSKSKSIEDAVELYFDNDKVCKNWDQINKTPRDGQIYFWNDHFYLYDSDSFALIDPTPNEVAEFVNDLWLSGKYVAFNFHNNAGPYDCYGDDDRHGPFWIRPSALQYSNIFVSGKFSQVIGHTQEDHPMTAYDGCSRFINRSIHTSQMDSDFKVVQVDCLGWNVESIIYDNENFIVNKA